MPSNSLQVAEAKALRVALCLLCIAIALVSSTTSKAQSAPADTQANQRCADVLQAVSTASGGSLDWGTLARPLAGKSGQDLALLGAANSDKGLHYEACLDYAAAAVAYRVSGDVDGRTYARNLSDAAKLEQQQGDGTKPGFSGRMTLRLLRVTMQATRERGIVPGSPSPAASTYNASLQPPSTGGPGPAPEATANENLAAPPPPSAGGTYTPLQGGDDLASDEARHDYVFSHVSGMGTPASCRGNWRTMGRNLQSCENDLHKQADAERAAGKWWDALEDYDRAKLAAYSGGNLGYEAMSQTDGRKDIDSHLHLAPTQPRQGVDLSRNVGAPPAGTYGCYSASAVISPGLGGNPLLVQGPQFAGDIWILDSSHYAGPSDKNNRGTFQMKGSLLVVHGGGYQDKPGSADTTQLVYVPDGVFHKPTIHVGWFTNGEPVAGLNCEYMNHD